MKFINKVEVIEGKDTIAAEVLINETDGYSSVIFLNNKEYEELKETINNLKDTALNTDNCIDIINYVTTADKGVNAIKLNNKSSDDFAVVNHGHTDLAKQISLVNHANTLSGDNNAGHCKVISNPSAEAVYENADAAGANSVAKLFKETAINRNLVKNVLFDDKGVVVGSDKAFPYNAKNIPMKFWIYDQDGNPVPKGVKATIVVWEMLSGTQSYHKDHYTDNEGVINFDLKGKLDPSLHICICNTVHGMGTCFLYAWNPTK